jgi:hypothetical protein
VQANRDAVERSAPGAHWPESVAAFDRIGWPLSVGIVAAFPRIPQIQRTNARWAAMRASLQVPVSLRWSASRARARAMTAVSKGTRMSPTFSSAAAIELGVGW